MGVHKRGCCRLVCHPRKWLLQYLSRCVSYMLYPRNRSKPRRRLSLHDAKDQPNTQYPSCICAVWVCVCACVCMHVCMCACIYVCTCVCVFMLMCACRCVCSSSGWWNYPLPISLAKRKRRKSRKVFLTIISNVQKSGLKSWFIRQTFFISQRYLSSALFSK